MNKVILLSCLVLVLSVQGLNADGPSLLVQIFGANPVSVFCSQIFFKSAIAQGFVAMISPCVILVRVVVVEVYSVVAGFSGFASMFQEFNAMLASVTAYTASYQAALSGASSFTLTSQISGSVAIGLYPNTMHGIGYCLSALAAIAVGVKPSSPADEINDPSFDETFPDTSEFPETGPPNIGVQARCLKKFIKTIISRIQKAAADYEDLRKETICDCDNVINTTSVKNVIDAWNEVSEIVSSSESSTESGILITKLDNTFISKFNIAMTSTNQMLTQVTISQSALVGAIQQGKVRVPKRCTLDQGKKSEGDNKMTNSKQLDPNATCQDRQKKAIKRQFNICKKKHEYKRREHHKKTKSLFKRCKTQVKEFCIFVGSASARFQFHIFFTFNASIKQSLNVFLSFCNRFVQVVSSAYEVCINASLQIVEKAQTKIVASIKAGITTIEGKVEELANQIIDDAPTFPCCQDYLNQTVAFYQNATKNISDCADQVDSTFDEISVKITILLAETGEAFTNFTNAVDDCLQKKCLFPGWMCCNWLWFPSDIDDVKTCIDNVNTAANKYADELPARVNASLIAAQAAADNATQVVQTCIDGQVANATAALVELKAKYASCKSNQCSNTTTTVGTTTTAATTSGTTTSATTTTVQTSAPAPKTYADQCEPLYPMGPPNWAPIKAKYPSGTRNMHFNYCQFGKFYNWDDMFQGVFLDCCLLM